jgi:hypothetical protein
MATDYANGYASIVKYDKNDDGTLMVYGNATDDTLDLDSQICDPTWLDSAMPAWFKSGGNVREMHGPSAAGVAKEYEVKAGQHWIGVHVVDPIAVKKVENRVYQGFSIGIKSPRVVRDSKAANGRIIDGQIIEVSLVDRPANPSAKLILAKSVDGEPTLIQVEEAHEYNAPLPSEIFKHGDHDQSDHNPNAGGGGGSEKPSESSGSSRDNEVAQNEVKNLDGISADISQARDFLGDIEDDNAQDAFNALNEAEQLIDTALGNLQDAQDDRSEGSHAARIEDAMRDLEVAGSKLDDAVDSISSIDADDADADETELSDTSDELSDMSSEIESTIEALGDYLDELYNREKSLTNKRESKMKKMERIKALAKSLTADQILELTESFAEISKSMDMPMNGESKAVPSRDEMVERYMAARKALDDVASEAKSYGYDDMDKAYGETAEEETAEGPAVAAETAEEEVREAEEQKPADETKAAEESEDEEEKSEDEEKKKVSKDDESEDDEAIKSLVEKAVKSAMDMVKGEIDTLRAEKESAVEKSVKLETELTTALSKSVAGGPKRTAIAQGAVSNEYLAKGLAYKAKADATTDPVLAKGYREIANELLAKADSKTITK